MAICVFSRRHLSRALPRGSVGGTRARGGIKAALGKRAYLFLKSIFHLAQAISIKRRHRNQAGGAGEKLIHRHGDWCVGAQQPGSPGPVSFLAAYRRLDLEMPS